MWPKASATSLVLVRTLTRPHLVNRVAVLLDRAGVAVSRRCFARATKHEVIRVLAISKINTDYTRISKALEDFNTSNDEYKLVLEEVNKTAPAQVRTGSLVTLISRQKTS